MSDIRKPLRKRTEGFPKSSRLLRRWEFLRVQRTGIKFHTRSFIVLLKKNRLENIRLGIAVSKKYGNSVKRNRIKRLVREIFRRNKQLFPESMDVVFVPKKRNKVPGYSEIIEQLRKLRWRKIG